MKKVLGLCMVILLSSVSVFAQDREQGNRKGRERDQSRRMERMAEELKLSDSQVAELQKINAGFKDKRNAEREAMRAEREKQREKMIAMKSQQDKEIKSLLSEEQYKLYTEKQSKMGKPNKGKMMRGDRERGHRPFPPHQRDRCKCQQG